MQVGPVPVPSKYRPAVFFGTYPPSFCKSVGMLQLSVLQRGSLLKLDQTDSHREHPDYDGTLLKIYSWIVTHFLAMAQIMHSNLQCSASETVEWLYL